MLENYKELRLIRLKGPIEKFMLLLKGILTEGEISVQLTSLYMLVQISCFSYS
jgi:hypothetical protein